MNLRLALYFGAVVAAAAGLYILIQRSYPAPANSRPEIIKSLFHQMSRWTTAAGQDDNPVVRVLHANYGMGYLMAIQSIASEAEMEQVLGIRNIKDLVQEVQRVQNEATVELVKQCPTAAPRSMLAKYGSEAEPAKRQSDDEQGQIAARNTLHYVQQDFSKNLFDQGQR